MYMCVCVFIFIYIDMRRTCLAKRFFVVDWLSMRCGLVELGLWLKSSPDSCARLDSNCIGRTATCTWVNPSPSNGTDSRGRTVAEG